MSANDTACPGCLLPLRAADALSDCNTCGARQHTPCWTRFRACAACQAADRWEAARDPAAVAQAAAAKAAATTPATTPAAAAGSAPATAAEPDPAEMEPLWVNLDPESAAGKERAEVLAAYESAGKAAYESHSPTSEKRYIQIWAVLVVLLVVSVLGPMLGVTAITLITAFGIAFVKAYLVIKYFMHMNIERPVVRYFLVLALAFMVLFFAGTAPDIKQHEGLNWEHTAAKQHVEQVLAEEAAQEAAAH